jgi:hypothetical protein
VDIKKRGYLIEWWCYRGGGVLLKLWEEGAKQAKARKGLEAECVFKTGRICAVTYYGRCNEHAILQTLPTRPLHTSRISHTCQSYDSVEHCKLSEAGHDVSGVRCRLGCCYLVIRDASLVWVTPSSLWDSWCDRRNSFCFCVLSDVWAEVEETVQPGTYNTV